MTGEVAAVVVVVVSVAAVLEDLVLLLQPLRANPARIKVNNIVFFIGGLSCSPSDRRSSDRFAIHRGCEPNAWDIFATDFCATLTREIDASRIVLRRNDQTMSATPAPRLFIYSGYKVCDP